MLLGWARPPDAACPQKKAGATEAGANQHLDIGQPTHLALAHDTNTRSATRHFSSGAIQGRTQLISASADTSGKPPGKPPGLPVSYRRRPASLTRTDELSFWSALSPHAGAIDPGPEAVDPRALPQREDGREPELAELTELRSSSATAQALFSFSHAARFWANCILASAPHDAPVRAAPSPAPLAHTSAGSTSGAAAGLPAAAAGARANCLQSMRCCGSRIAARSRCTATSARNSARGTHLAPIRSL